MLKLVKSLARHSGVFLIIIATAVGLWACKKADQDEKAHKRWKLTMIKYEEMRQTMDAEKGFRSGLADAGLREGIDFEIATRNAQGDIKTVLTLLDAVMVDGTDLLVSLQTPTFESAVRRRSRMPLAFMVVANPFTIPGVGVTDSSHNELLTGVYTNTPFDILLGHIKATMPGVQRIGSLAANFELNATYYKNQLQVAGKRAGLDVKFVGVLNKTSIALDAEKLCQSGIDAIVQIEDNLTSATFPTIAKIAREYKIPVFSFVNKQVEQGSIMVYAPDYVQAGQRTAALAAKVIRGASPGELPFRRIEKFDFMVNLDAAREAGVTIPPEVLAKADKVIDSQGN